MRLRDLVRLFMIGAFALTFVAANAGAAGRPMAKDCCGKSCPTPKCCKISPAKDEAAVPRLAVPVVFRAAAFSLPAPTLTHRLSPVRQVIPRSVLSEWPTGLSPPIPA